MKKLNEVVLFTLLVVLSLNQPNAQNNTDSPYFIIKNSKTGMMPLESNQAEVYISGIIADVNLTQTYKNNTQEIIEAIYVFPGSSQAAIYDLEMQIGNRIIKAELKEKEEARNAYNKAKESGQRTSLLEQHRPNVFQMSVANIMPGEKVQVRLKYTEKIIPSNGEYQFSLPMVVGPRYNNLDITNNASFVNMPYQSENVGPEYTYEVEVFLQAGQDIKNIASHTHKVQIKKYSERLAHIRIDPSDFYSGNKDFVLSYKLSGANISSGLLMYEHQDENFFLATIQPPNIISEFQIPDKEYIFIVDVSGSMFGFPLEVSKKMIKDLLKGLRPTDKFNIMLFAGTAYMFSDTSIYANTENIEKVLENMEQQQGSGSTELLPALYKAINLPRTGEGLSRSIVILTDGYISVEKEAFDLVRNNLNKANLFAFGIGSGTNRFLIEGLANAGQGLPFFVENEEVACDVAEQFIHYISNPSLTNITVSFQNFDAYDIEPKSIPDLLGERPINIIGKWTGNNKGNIIIEGYYGGYKYQQIINTEEYSPDVRNKSLRLLWAREKIRLMDDYRKILYDESHKQSMIDLSLKYNLLTAYTSFVAVDYEIVRNEEQLVRTMKQALPLPDGVSNYALGAEMEIKKVTTKSKAVGVYLKIGKLSGIENVVVLSELKMQILKHLGSIKQCIQNSKEKEVYITMKFDAQGNLKFVQLSNNVNESISKCLEEEMLSWNFETLNISPNAEILVPLELEKLK